MCLAIIEYIPRAFLSLAYLKFVATVPKSSYGRWPLFYKLSE